MIPMRGPGRFQWNTGGFFGGQIGGTCWLLPMAYVLFWGGDLSGGAILILCFAAPNILGTFLWTRRASIPPYPAIQALLLGVAVAAYTAFFILLRSDVLVREVHAGAWAPVFLPLLLFPGMMLMFHVIEKEARQHRPPKD